MAKSDRAESNRRNAAKSTGPKTENGKSRSALNRASHGLRSQSMVIPGERAEDWQAFAKGIALDLGAEGMAESAAANLIAGCLWRLARVPRYLAGVASEGMDRNQLEEELDEESAWNEPEDIIKGKAMATSGTIESWRESIEELEDEVAYLESMVEIASELDDLEKHPDSERVCYLTVDDFGNLAGTPEAMCKAVRKPEEPDECTFADLREIVAAGTKGREPIIRHYQFNLFAKMSDLKFYRDSVAAHESKREEAIQFKAEQQVIPNGSVMKQVAAFESETTRTLARLMETFRELREAKAESAPKRPRIAVASIAKKAKKPKNVQT